MTHGSVRISPGIIWIWVALVVVVSLGDEGAAQSSEVSQEWDAVELFRLGGMNGPVEQQFTDRRLSLSVGPNDQLLVLDYAAAHVQVFSALDGRFVRTIARRGEGPGELRGGTALGWEAEELLWVRDSGNGRFSVFDSTGVPVRSVRRPEGTMPQWTDHLRFDAEGRLIELTQRQLSPYLRAIDPQSGEVLQTFAEIPPPQATGAIDQGTFLRLPEEARNALRRFRPWVVWDWSPDGLVWFAAEDAYRLVAIDADGDTLRVIEGLREPREFSRREEELLGQVRRRLEDVRLAPPQVQSITRLPDGHLLVQRPGEMNEPGRVFDVITADGRLVGEVAFPLPVWPRSGIAVRENRVYVVGRGDLDVPIVMAIELRR